jgi:uncharacterized OB-fold protein
MLTFYGRDEEMDATVGIPPGVCPETCGFWDAAAQGRLVAERCTSCGAASFPPRGACRRCRGRQMDQVWMPGLAVPFVIVIVDFPAYPGVRVAGRLRSCPPEAARIEMAVAVGFEPGPGGFSIPSFVAVPDGD